MRVAFLFDNDGVLIDSSAIHWSAWQQLMESERELKMNHSHFIRTFGKRNDLLLKELMPEAPEAKRKSWADQKEAFFREKAKGSIQLIEGMEGFLKQVSEAKIPRIIASSTPLANLQLFIAHTVLGLYFEHYLSAEQVAHGKPFPDVFLAAAAQLGYEPSECIVFEDAPSGIAAAKAAGCFIVALGTTHPEKTLSDYHLFYPSPRELNLKEILEAFKQWQKD